MKQMTLQPTQPMTSGGMTSGGRTSNGPTAYVWWDGVTRLTTEEREAILGHVEKLSTIESSRWRADGMLELKRMPDLKWGDLRGAIEDAINTALSSNMSLVQPAMNFTV
jgi:hypothetical protein